MCARMPGTFSLLWSGWLSDAVVPPLKADSGYFVSPRWWLCTAPQQACGTGNRYPGARDNLPASIHALSSSAERTNFTPHQTTNHSDTPLGIDVCVYVRRAFVKPQPHCMDMCACPSVGSSSYCTLHLLTQWNIFCLLLLSSSPPDPIGYEVIGQCRKSARLFLWDLCLDVGHRVEFNLWW